MIDEGGGVVVEITEEVEEEVFEGGIETGVVLEHVNANKVETGVVINVVDVIGIGIVVVLVPPK